jgi:hypothetical protein
MVYDIQDYWGFGLCPSSGILKNRRTQRFGKWICFRPQVSGQETPTQLGPLERASLNPVEAGSNTSTVALRVIGGDEKGTQCLGVQPGHRVPGGYKYGDLAFQA